MGLLAFLRKKSHRSQMMMRGRIAAQGFTLVAMLGGLWNYRMSPAKPKP